MSAHTGLEHRSLAVKTPVILEATHSTKNQIHSNNAKRIYREAVSLSLDKKFCRVSHFPDLTQHIQDSSTAKEHFTLARGHFCGESRDCASQPEM